MKGFEDLDVAGLVVSCEKMNFSSFKRGDLIGVTFDVESLSRVDFKHINLTGALF